MNWDGQLLAAVGELQTFYVYKTWNIDHVWIGQETMLANLMTIRSEKTDVFKRRMLQYYFTALFYLEHLSYLQRDLHHAPWSLVFKH